jgi:hypothetical protein
MLSAPSDSPSVEAAGYRFEPGAITPATSPSGATASATIRSPRRNRSVANSITGQLVADVAAFAQEQSPAAPALALLLVVQAGECSPPGETLAHRGMQPSQ